VPPPQTTTAATPIPAEQRQPQQAAKPQADPLASPLQSNPYLNPPGRGNPNQMGQLSEADLDQFFSTRANPETNRKVVENARADARRADNLNQQLEYLKGVSKDMGSPEYQRAWKNIYNGIVVDYLQRPDLQLAPGDAITQERISQLEPVLTQLATQGTDTRSIGRLLNFFRETVPGTHTSPAAIASRIGQMEATNERSIDWANYLEKVDEDTQGWFSPAQVDYTFGQKFSNQMYADRAAVHGAFYNGKLNQPLTNDAFQQVTEGLLSAEQNDFNFGMPSGTTRRILQANGVQVPHPQPPSVGSSGAW
jgi:hypothetical protein